MILHWCYKCESRFWSGEFRNYDICYDCVKEDEIELSQSRLDTLQSYYD